jgi:hypothetical protein
LSYNWHLENDETDGVLETGESTDHYAYWTTPDVAGTYRVSCTVTDDEDKNQTHVFEVVVRARSVETLYGPGSDDPVHAGQTVLSMEKQSQTLIGGVWISTDAGEIRYINSSSDQTTLWEGAFDTIYIGYNDLTYTLWGGTSANTNISIQSSGNAGTLSCQNCVSINDILYDAEALYVGADSGMHRYLPSTLEWAIIKPEQTNAIVRGKVHIYFATSQGIYRFDPMNSIVPTMTPDPTGETWAILEVDGDDKTTQDVVENVVTLWHVTEDKVCRNGVELVSQPSEVAHTLDVDINGYIWCGKYRWDGSSWWSPPNLEIQEIINVVSSAEGRVYFLTSSGALLRW